MKRSIRHTCAAAVVAVGLLTACTGCDPLTLSTAGFSVLSSATSYGTGWIMGTLTTLSQTGTKCYLNGTEIDCSEIPSGS